MMYAFIRWWATQFLRSYFRKTIVYGSENVPPKGPLIVASNHPSAFMEASLLTTVMKRPIHFMVRGDMFNPRFKFLFKWTKQIPIYRKKDGIANLRKNAASFEYTYRELGKGEAVLIFPEAKTTLEKKMRPVQKGTAHLAFGAMPYIKEGEELTVQPVGVNFTEPRYPGTDVVVVFGTPFITQHASREDRIAIENFTNTLSDALSPLIIQVDDELEKNYDLLAAVYFRMVHDNKPGRNAFDDLQKLAGVINDKSSINIVVDQTDEINRELIKNKLKTAIYFPDLIVLNKVGLLMLAFLKIIWLIAGGWIWRLIRGVVYRKIKTPTFQGPTTVGVSMVVIPLMAILLLIILLVVNIPLLDALRYWFQWIVIMWAGTLIRPPLDIIWKLLMLNGNAKDKLKSRVLDLREEAEQIVQPSTDRKKV